MVQGSGSDMKANNVVHEILAAGAEIWLAKYLIIKIIVAYPSHRVHLPPEMSRLMGAPVSSPRSHPKGSSLSQAYTPLENLPFSHSRFVFLLVGRLGTTINDDNTTYFFINCNGVGSQFVHAVAHSVTAAGILQSVYVPTSSNRPLINSFFPLNGVHNSEGVSLSFPGVQVTELVDGIFIVHTVDHLIADDASF